jgi:hypothetical protein
MGHRRRLALLAGLFLPLALTCCQSGPPPGTAAANKVIVLGIDGMDPGLLGRFVQEGRMPN